MKNVNIKSMLKVNAFLIVTDNLLYTLHNITSAENKRIRHLQCSHLTHTHTYKPTLNFIWWVWIFRESQMDCNAGMCEAWGYHETQHDCSFLLMEIPFWLSSWLLLLFLSRLLLLDDFFSYPMSCLRMINLFRTSFPFRFIRCN